MLTTVNYGLKKPELNDYVSIADLNDNMDILDNVIDEINTDVSEHVLVEASDLQLGHVRVDNETIIINPDGVISTNIYETIKDFIVKEGQSITAQDVVGFVNGGLAKILGTENIAIDVGDPTAFNSSNTIYVSACALTETKVLVVYSNLSDSGDGTAIILTISGTTITPGTPFIFDDLNSTHISVCKLTETKALVAYRSEYYSGAGYAVILNISGTTITKGTATLFESGSTVNISACKLTETKVLVAYVDSGNSGYGSSIILSISGNVITPGSIYVFRSAAVSYIASCALTESKVLAAYNDVSGAGNVIVLSISGTTISAGGTYNFTTNEVSHISICKLADDRALVAYKDIDSSGNGYFFIPTVIGTVVEIGNNHIFSSYSPTNIVTSAITGNMVLISYYDNISNIGAAIIITISDALIRYSERQTFSAHTLNCILSSSSAIVIYSYGPNFGTANILTGFQNVLDNVIGIAKESKVGGEDCKVSLGPITSGLTGLTAGATYYVDASGHLSKYPGYCKIGVAISTTELRQVIQKL